MNVNLIKIRKLFCIFFVCLFLILISILSVLGVEYRPNDEIYSYGDRTPVNGTYVSSVYGFYLKEWDSVTNIARYAVASYYDFEGRAQLFSDNLYVNDTFVGTFDSNNGWHNKGTIQRDEVFSVYFHSGRNYIETRNVEGVGGESMKSVTIRNFATPPEVIGTNGVWNENDVSRGIRTWESIYTDGATGSAQGNKIQTSTGFMYKDVDEQPTPIEPYKNSVLGNNSRITEIKNASTGVALPLSITTLNNAGTYWIKSCTKDSGGLEGCGSRYITVLKNDPPVITGTDKIFYQGQYTQDYWVNTLRWSEMNAADSEDGNITSRVTIIYDNVNVNVPGNYSVVYSVTDSGGKSASKEIKVTVKYNNPPSISGEDRWFYVEEDVTNENLMERVKATDEEDGDISRNATIKFSNVQSGVLGSYDVTYQIKDAFGKTAETSVKVHIVSNTIGEDEEIRYLRFIRADYLNTLKEKSIWRMGDYQSILMNAVGKTQDEQAIEVWHITSNDIKAMKIFDEENAYSKQSAQAFFEQFKRVIQ